MWHYIIDLNNKYSIDLSYSTLCNKVLYHGQNNSISLGETMHVCFCWLNFERVGNLLSFTFVPIERSATITSSPFEIDCTYDITLLGLLLGNYRRFKILFLNYFILIYDYIILVINNLFLYVLLLKNSQTDIKINIRVIFCRQVKSRLIPTLIYLPSREISVYSQCILICPCE